MAEKLTHVAIIMDGNRRWATEKNMPKMLGHTQGAKNVRTIAQAAQQLGIDYLTLWALSTENLKNRSEKELSHLFSLFSKLIDYLHEFVENNVQLRIIGDISQLPDSVEEKITQAVFKTKDNDGMTLTLAINYGGQDEIVRAVRNILKDGKTPDEIDALEFAKYLDTQDMPDPQLIIRTGGHQRLSGYLPWQSTYAELYFTPVYWPAFDEEELKKAVSWHDKQVQNRGK